MSHRSRSCSISFASMRNALTAAAKQEQQVKDRQHLSGQTAAAPQVYLAPEARRQSTQLQGELPGREVQGETGFWRRSRRGECATFGIKLVGSCTVTRPQETGQGL